MREFRCRDQPLDRKVKPIKQWGPQTSDANQATVIVRKYPVAT